MEAHIKGILLGTFIAGILLSSNPVSFVLTIAAGYAAVVCLVKAAQCIAEGPEGFRHRRKMWEIERGLAPVEKDPSHD